MVPLCKNVKNIGQKNGAQKRVQVLAWFRSCDGFKFFSCYIGLQIGFYFGACMFPFIGLAKTFVTFKSNFTQNERMGFKFQEDKQVQ